MTEKEFLDLIDCKFPYSDFEKAKEIIDNAIKISSNCVFGVIHELLRLPKSQKDKISKATLLYLLDYINTNFVSELKTKNYFIFIDIVNQKKN